MTVHRIPEGVGEMALERYLRRAWPMLPGGVLRAALKRRDVRVNGRKCPGKEAVRGGDELTLYLDSRWLEADARVLFSDDRLIVALKPQGLPVDVDREGIGADTLLNRLRRRWPQARLCHRLDAQTGGILLAAADESVWEQALEAFSDHRGVRKHYHALAFGRFDPPEGTLDAYLLKDARRGKVRLLHHSAPGAKPIRTVYRAGEACGPGLFHLWLEPVTGRTHQLRAHMADFGHPLLGDDRYGDRTANRRYPGVKLCLWHERLDIPRDSALSDYAGMHFEASAPNWLEALQRGTGGEDSGEEGL